MGSVKPEAQFEKEVIERLSKHGWTYRQDLDFQSEDALLENWRGLLNSRNLCRLNQIPLSDGEFSQLKEQIFQVKTPLEAGKLLLDGKLELVRDVAGYENEKLYLEFFWKHDVGAGLNQYEVVRQIKRNATISGRKDRIFDVTLLISGIPVIHLELKRKGVTVKAAYNQIREYAEADHFSGFYSLIQLFAILNPDETRYFANPGDYQKYNYKYTFAWKDFKNNPINEATGFIEEVLSVPMGHKLVTQYTIQDDAKGTLKVLRSYQIYAIEAILNKLQNPKFDGTKQMGGYIWHTTGSGKTMTSFKAAQLIGNLPKVDKVIFLADRRELTKQTMDEYSSFADSPDEVTDTKNTYGLLKALQSQSGNKLIITSIQKMRNLADLGEQEKITHKHMVFMVDEAHRSTFGKMMLKIKDRFPRAIWFGFTGTPILDENKNEDMTTADVFGDNLHVYSVGDGIRDGNVLAFDVRGSDTKNKNEKRKKVAEYKDPGKGKLYQEWMDRKKKSDLEVENQIPEANYACREHYELVVEDMLEKWEDNSTNRLFSAILTVPNISTATEYFNLLKDNSLGLRVTMIYDDSDRHEDDSLDHRLELEKAILHYNGLFDKSYSLDSLQAYKEDVADRLAQRNEYANLEESKRLDLIIVVRQLLTGFDAPYINTLYLDKTMEYANLIQAFSRTNRLVDDRKPFGIIEYYRRPERMKDNIQRAFKHYANSEAEGIMYVDSYDKNIEKIKETFHNITTLFPQTADGEPDFSNVPAKEEEQKQFVKWMNALEQILIKLRQQGFQWEKDLAKINFTHTQYLELQARYADLATGTGGGIPPRGALEINTVLVSGDSIRIDSDYLASLLNELGAKVNNEISQKATQTTEKLKEQIHQLFNGLRANDRRVAEKILRDVQVGKIPHIDSFEALLDQYKKEETDHLVQNIVDRFKLTKDDFMELMNSHVLGNDDWNAFNRMDKVVSSVDWNLVGEVFKEKNPTKSPNKLSLKTFVTTEIKETIIEILRSR